MKKNIWVYVSGPMTGMPRHNRPAFNRAAKLLRKKGYSVVNPAELDAKEKKSLPWVDCLRRDIKALMKCHEVALLQGWESSRGANLEVHIARQLGMKIYYLSRRTL